MVQHTRRFRVGWIGPALAAGIVALTSGQPARDILAQASNAQVVNSLRMYVFDLGNIPVDQGNMFDPPIQVAKGGCCIIVAHLIVHPKGRLIWDTGVVPDELIGSGKPGTNVYPGGRSGPSSPKSVTDPRTSPTSPSRTITSTTRPTPTCSRTRRGSCRTSNEPRCATRWKAGRCLAGRNPYRVTTTSS